MYQHQSQIRVRYGETDQMGYLYYGNYAQYYEVGRVEAMRNLGISYKKLEEEDGILMPVVSMSMRFVRPAHYDELLLVQTSIKKIPNFFINFFVEIFNEKMELVNGGQVKLCFVDAKTKQTIATPEALVKKIKNYFDKT